MHQGLLLAALHGVLKMLRRAGFAPLARMGATELHGFALGIAYFFQARAWTLRRREPGRAAVQRAWAPAEYDVGIRDATAGRLHPQDRVELVAEGAAAFARRAAMYAAAGRSIDIATYYLQADDTGRGTVQALAKAVERGVQVRLLVDRFIAFKKGLEVPGTTAVLDEARAAGIQLKAWHDSTRPYDSNHRKMILVDGGQALVGGRNFADHYRGDDWRDLDLVIEGPSVAPLTAAFDAIWHAAERGGDGAHAAPPWVDRVPAALLHDAVMRFVLSAIGAAVQRIDLELAYFVEQEALCAALARAAHRGVQTRLLTNSNESNDLPHTVRAAYRGMRRLLAAGCRVHARRGAGRTLHPKYVVVDSEWVSFGSHNLEGYSVRYCCENNLVVRDAALAARLTAEFDAEWARTTPVDEAEVARQLRAYRGLWLVDRVFHDFQ